MTPLQHMFDEHTKTLAMARGAGDIEFRLATRLRVWTLPEDSEEYARCALVAERHEQLGAVADRFANLRDEMWNAYSRAMLPIFWGCRAAIVDNSLRLRGGL